MGGLTAAIKSMQDDINQYLTSQMAANNENMDTSKEELEQDGEVEEDDEDEQAPPSNNNNKKQKTK